MARQKLARVGRKRIAVGGFQHETNTFAPQRAPFDAFEISDSWPSLTVGDDLLSALDGMNIPLAGFIHEADQYDFELLPLCWCSAEPSSYVTTDAFERISGIICAGLTESPPVDAVYLDLHGAMVTEDHEDGEGELLRRIRAIVGDIPVVISLDLHANVTPQMAELCDVMTIYRTYPHLDMAASGQRACRMVSDLLQLRPVYKAYRQIPFLIPLPAQCTDFEPCRSVYSKVVELAETNGVTNLDFATGFPPADIHNCGASIVAYGSDQDVADMVADQLYSLIVAREPQFRYEMLTPEAAIVRAQENTLDGPVVLADAQDNPGAGATSDTTGLLQAMINQGVQGAVLGVMHDPDVADLAHRLGVGAKFDADVGGKLGFAGVEPLSGRFKVEALGDGSFDYTGEMYGGSRAEIGAMTLLRVVDAHADVRVIVGSVRSQCLDLAIFRHLGVEPTEQKILAIKSTVHFRADFDPIAAATYVVAAPGANGCVPAELDYKNLRPGVRLTPNSNLG